MSVALTKVLYIINNEDGSRSIATITFMNQFSGWVWNQHLEDPRIEVQEVSTVYVDEDEPFPSISLRPLHPYALKNYPR